MMPMATANGADTEKPVEYLLRTGRFKEASWVLERYCDEFPPEMGIYGNLAICHLMSGEAMKAVGAAKKALDFEPANAQLLEQLGRASMIAGEYDESIAALRSLIKVAPTYTEGYALLGMALRCERRFDEAYETYESFSRINGRRDVHIDSSVVFTQEMDGRTTLAQRLETRRWWYDQHKTPWRFHTWTNDPDPDRPLTIGYISGDFRTHSAAYAFRPLIIDRNKDAFRAVLISIEGQVDALGDLFRQNSDTWLHMPADNDEQIAWAVRNAKIDILVDLSGHTPGNRLRMLTTKPAPVQVTMIGCIGSSGIPDIDYTMVDEGYVTPEEAAQYADKVWNLPSAIHFQIPDYAPAVAPSPCAANGYVTFGCVQHFSKITDQTLAAWGDIMRRVPTARFYIKDDVVTSEAGAARVVKGLGIEPARITMESTTAHGVHLADHAKLDVSLDTWPQGGGVTTLEAIAMGVPVLSIAGDRPYQRGCIAVSRHLPQDVMVTNSVEEYTERAIALADRRAWLEAERMNRRGRLQASPLGDTQAWVDSIEAAYRTMWREWVARDAR